MIRFVIVLTAGLVLSATASAQQQPLDDRWYIVPSAGVVKLDGKRQTDHNEAVLGLSFGRFFSPRFSLDLRVDQYRSDFDTVPAGVSDRFRLRSYGVVGRYYLGQLESDTRPYAFLGTGLQEHDSWLDDGRDIFGSAGLGLEHAYNDRVSVRMEAEYRYDNDRDTFDQSSGFKDLMFTAGLKIHFGEKPRPAAPPAPPPEPVREPAPRPVPPPAPAPEPEIAFEFSAEVLFPFDSSELRPGARAELNEAAAMLKQHPELHRVEVAGHTCDLGAADYNQGLSERRAQSVYNYLVAEGVAAERLSVRGYGEDRPAVSNSSEENRKRNRRVELIVLERRDG